MKSSLLLTILFVIFGLAAGGAAGRARFQQTEDHRALCPSCHHGARDMMERADESPHSITFQAKCHMCHVLPVKQYLTWSYRSWNLAVPTWVETFENPVIDQQSCMECHLARGRGVLPCAECHVGGSRKVEIAERCEVCHDEHPALPPHSVASCRDCHADALVSHDRRVNVAMESRLRAADLFQEPANVR